MRYALLASSLAASLALLTSPGARAATRVLPITETLQEHDQWCWAGVSRCTLLHFGQDVRQCELAEYARAHTDAPDLNYGTQDCCVAWDQGCNGWNYFWFYKGSIQDLLTHFGGLRTTTSTGTLPAASFTAAIDEQALVVIRWEWDGGGGHFVVGHGYDGTALYYMNPWPGEGRKIGEYAWIARGDTHTWQNSLTVAAKACTDGEVCDDADPCTTSDTCRAGVCRGEPVLCPASDCLGAGQCNPKTGKCAQQPDLPDGTACPTGECQAGVCTAPDPSCSTAGTAPWPWLGALVVLALRRRRRGRSNPVLFR